MANETPTDPASGRSDDTSSEPRQVEPRFTRERLLTDEGAVIAGHPQHLVVGALERSNDDEFTRGEINQLVKRFLDRKTETQES